MELKAFETSRATSTQPGCSSKRQRTEWVTNSRPELQATPTWAQGPPVCQIPAEAPGACQIHAIIGRALSNGPCQISAKSLFSCERPRKNIKKQHLHTRGAETDNRGTAQYGGMTSGAKPSTGALKQRRRLQQQRAQPGQAAEATGQAQQGGAGRGAAKELTAATMRIGCTQPGHVGWPSSKPSAQTEQHVAQPTSQLAVGRRARARRYGGREG